MTKKFYAELVAVSLIGLVCYAIGIYAVDTAEELLWWYVNTMDVHYSIAADAVLLVCNIMRVMIRMSIVAAGALTIKEIVTGVMVLIKR